MGGQRRQQHPRLEVAPLELRGGPPTGDRVEDRGVGRTVQARRRVERAPLRFGERDAQRRAFLQHELPLDRAAIGVGGQDEPA